MTDTSTPCPAADEQPGERPTIPRQRQPVDDASHTEQPVDLPEQPTDTPPAYRRPLHAPDVLPAWVVSREERRHLLRWLRSWASHRSRYHGARVPKYAMRVLVYLLRGLRRCLAGWREWVADTESVPLRASVVASKASAEYLALTKVHREAVRRRAWLTVLGLLVSAPGLVVLAVVWPTALEAVTTIVAALLVWVGRPLDQPFLTDRATVTGVAPVKLTSDIVARALGAIGVGELRRAVDKHELAFVEPIVRDGAGYRATLDLPHGVTVATIADKREELSSGLRRPLGCVWPQGVRDEHEGRLVLYVADRPLSALGNITYPLVKSGTSDYFGRIPLGVNPRGDAIDVPLFEQNILIGAIPGAGKTALVRTIALGAALDPSVEIWCAELKGNGDLECMEHVASRYVSGVDRASIAIAADWQHDLTGEIQRRVKVLKSVPRDMNTDGKLTRAIADQLAWDLRPLVFIGDEIQNLFTDPIVGNTAGEATEANLKLARALGVTIILATQRPDRDSLPKGISANVSIRAALRVTGQIENDMILGTSAYKNGIRATQFGVSDRGVLYLVGAHDEPQVVKCAYIDKPTADRIALRARALREAAGTLAGHALGEHDESDRLRVDVLDDVLAVFGDDERLWSETICQRLASLRPSTYTGWTPTALAAALRPYGLASAQKWGTDDDGQARNRNGYDRTDIARAHAER